MDGRLVTETWIGDRDDPPLASAADYRVASRFVAVAGVVAALLACTALFRSTG